MTETEATLTYDATPGVMTDLTRHAALAAGAPAQARCRRGEENTALPDDLIDEIAALILTDDTDAIHRRYAADDALRVPPTVMSTAASRGLTTPAGWSRSVSRITRSASASPPSDASSAVLASWSGEPKTSSACARRPAQTPGVNTARTTVQASDASLLVLCARARDRVAVAHHAREPFGDFAEHPVSNLGSKVVVDLFELVEIDHEQ